LVEFNKNKRLKVVIHDFNTDITTTYGSINEASKAIKVDIKAFWGYALLRKNLSKKIIM